MAEATDYGRTLQELDLAEARIAELEAALNKAAINLHQLKGFADINLHQLKGFAEQAQQAARKALEESDDGIT